MNRSEYKRKWSLKNRKKHLLQMRLWWAKNKESKNRLRKEYRHKNGISKKYHGESIGISKNIIKKAANAKEEYLGEITGRIIQMVYEDNIKKHGTLTCYLCFKTIEFGQDSLDHKTSASRGGTNEYSNLAIAHVSCNKKKHSQTEIEYRKENNLWQKTSQ